MVERGTLKPEPRYGGLHAPGPTQNPHSCAAYPSLAMPLRSGLSTDSDRVRRPRNEVRTPGGLRLWRGSGGGTSPYQSGRYARPSIGARATFNSVPSGTGRMASS
jgi:hypothetical protein